MRDEGFPAKWDVGPSSCLLTVFSSETALFQQPIEVRLKPGMKHLNWGSSAFVPFSFPGKLKYLAILSELRYGTRYTKDQPVAGCNRQI